MKRELRRQNLARTVCFGICAVALCVFIQSSRAGEGELSSLVIDGVKAVIANDQPAFVAHYPTIDELVEACPELLGDPEVREDIERKLEYDKEYAASSIQACHDQFDLKKAQVINIDIGPPNTVPECDGFNDYMSIVAHLRIGKKHVAVGMSGIMVNDKVHRLYGAPYCYEEEGRKSKVPW